MPFSSSAPRSVPCPVPPPLPVGASATWTVGAKTLPYQAFQKRAFAIGEARRTFCGGAPTSTSTDTSTSTATATELTASS